MTNAQTNAKPAGDVVTRYRGRLAAGMCGSCGKRKRQRESTQCELCLTRTEDSRRRRRWEMRCWGGVHWREAYRKAPL